MSETYRITVDPNQCGGRPCLRGLRIRVKDVLDLLAAGAGRDEILADYPLLEAGDITAALEYAARTLHADQLDGNRPLPWDRDALGGFVREAWVRWAETQPDPKPSWLVPYAALSEPEQEVYRQIGEVVARWTLIGDAARAAQREMVEERNGR